tara:strand:+ start:16450 stop:17412 length:963 start_codon:yes stop_codon:yes gene_type:complete
MNYELLISKYTPNSLSKLDYHYNIKKNLTKLCSINHLDNILFYGPSGSCKKTLIKCFLNDYYNNYIPSLNYKFILSNNYKYNYYYNNYYIEIHPSDYPQNNNLVFTELIPHLCSSSNIINNYKLIIIYNIEVFLENPFNLQIINKFIEKYYKIKFIFSCNKFINLKTQLNIRVPALSVNEIINIILYINKKEHINFDYNKLKTICIDSKRNLNNVFISLQCHLLNLSFYKLSPNYICKIIFKNNINDLFIIKTILYEILSKDLYSIQSIFEAITDIVLTSKKIHDIPKLLNYATTFEFESKNKSIISLEAYIISIYNLLN